MPLLDTDFDQKFVRVTEDLTVDEALDALKAQDGEDDWHFFVDQPDSLIGVIKVSQLKEYLADLGPALFGLTFGQLRARVPAGRTAQQDEIGIGTAEEWALADPQAVLIVMRGDRIVGRLYKGTQRGNDDPFPASTMGQLYGNYIDTHPDARSRWRPAGTVPPTCPNCGHQDFFRYRVVDGASYCDNCGETIAEGD